MAEVLSASVSLQTSSAFAAVNALNGAVDKLDTSIATMSKLVDEAEVKFKDMAKAAQMAADQFRSTGAESDRLRMEEMRKALTESRTNVEYLEKELKKLSDSVKDNANVQKASAEKIVSGNAAIATSAKESGTAQAAAADTGVKGHDKLKDKTKDTFDITEKLTSSVKGMLLSYLGLGGAIKIVEALNETTRKAIESRRELGEQKLTFDEQIQAVIDNLPSAGGVPVSQDQAGKLVARLQQGAGGIKADVAAELIAKAQALQFNAADVSAQGAVTPGADFGIVEEVAKFAKRNRLDVPTAGKLLQVMRLSGAKTTADVVTRLATLEGGMQDVSITNPREAYSALIGGAATQLAQLPTTATDAERISTLSKSTGLLAAAALGTTEAPIAATRMEQFTRVAAGTDEVKRLNLARMAQQRGLITPDMLAAGMAEMQPTIKGDHELAIESATSNIEESQASISKIDRESGDRQTKAEEQKRRLESSIQHSQFELSDPKKRKHRANEESERVRMLNESIRADREAISNIDTQTAQASADAAARKQSIETTIREGKARIAAMQKKDQQKLTDAGLGRAFQRLDLGKRTQLIMDVTQGMSAEQLSVFASQVAEGDIAQGLATMLSPAGRAAFDKSVQSAAAGGANIPGYNRRNEAFGTNTLGQRELTAAQNQQSALGAVQAGQLFYNNIEDLAAQDTRILKAKGAGDTSINAQLPTSAPTLTYSASADGLKAKRVILIVRDRWILFVRSMDVRTYTRNKKWIDETTALVNRNLERISTDESMFYSGTDMLKDAEATARAVGAVINQLSNEALQKGERLGKGSGEGLSLPATRGDLGSDVDPAATGFQPRSDAGGGFNLPPSGVGSSDTSLLSGAVASGGGGGATYNISVGTLVSAAAEDGDLPGRLGIPDIG